MENLKSQIEFQFNSEIDVPAQSQLQSFMNNDSQGHLILLQNNKQISPYIKAEKNPSIENKIMLLKANSLNGMNNKQQNIKIIYQQNQIGDIIQQDFCFKFNINNNFNLGQQYQACDKMTCLLQSNNFLTSNFDIEKIKKQFMFLVKNYGEFKQGDQNIIVDTLFKQFNFLIRQTTFFQDVKNLQKLINLQKLSLYLNQFFNIELLHEIMETCRKTILILGNYFEMTTFREQLYNIFQNQISIKNGDILNNIKVIYTQLVQLYQTEEYEHQLHQLLQSDEILQNEKRHSQIHQKFQFSVQLIFDENEQKIINKNLIQLYKKQLIQFAQYYKQQLWLFEKNQLKSLDMFQFFSLEQILLNIDKQKQFYIIIQNEKQQAKWQKLFLAFIKQLNDMLELQSRVYQKKYTVDYQAQQELLSLNTRIMIIEQSKVRIADNSLFNEFISDTREFSNFVFKHQKNISDSCQQTILFSKFVNQCINNHNNMQNMKKSLIKYNELMCEMDKQKFPFDSLNQMRKKIINIFQRQTQNYNKLIFEDDNALLLFLSQIYDTIQDQMQNYDSNKFQLLTLQEKIQQLQHFDFITQKQHFYNLLKIVQNQQSTVSQYYIQEIITQITTQIKQKINSFDSDNLPLISISFDQTSYEIGIDDLDQQILQYQHQYIVSHIFEFISVLEQITGQKYDFIYNDLKDRLSLSRKKIQEIFVEQFNVLQQTMSGHIEKIKKYSQLPKVDTIQQSIEQLLGAISKCSDHINELLTVKSYLINFHPGNNIGKFFNIQKLLSSLLRNIRLLLNYYISTCNNFIHIIKSIFQQYQQEQNTIIFKYYNCKDMASFFQNYKIDQQKINELQQIVIGLENLKEIIEQNKLNDKINIINFFNESFLHKQKVDKFYEDYLLTQTAFFEELKSIKSDVEKQLNLLNNEFKKIIFSKKQNGFFFQQLFSLKIKFDEFKKINSDFILQVTSQQNMFVNFLNIYNDMYDFFYNGDKDYNIVFNFLQQIENFMQQNFMNNRQKISDLKEILQQAQNQKYSNDEYTGDLKQLLDKYTQFTDVIQIICFDDLTQQHVKRLQKTLIITKQMNEITFNDLLQNDNVCTQKQFLEELSQQAKNESTLREMVTELKKFLITEKLSFRIHKYAQINASYNFISDFENLKGLFEDKIAIIQSMLLSKYNIPLINEINSLNTNITLLNDHIEKLSIIQHKWMSLIPIMKSAYIMKHKVQECEIFSKNDNELVQLYDFLQKEQLVKALLDQSSIFKHSDTIINEFEQIQKSLSSFLEEQRINFPKFFFIGDGDLLEYLGNYDKKPTIEKILSKIFQNVKNVIMDEKTSFLHSLASDNKELLSFDEGININAQKTQWILQLPQIIEQHLQKKLQQLFSKNSDKLIIQEEQLQQIIILHSEILFFNNLNTQNYPSIIQKLDDNIKECQSYITNKQPLLNQKYAYILSMIHQRDVSQKMQDQENYDDFYYFGLLKYFYDTEKGVTIKIGLYEQKYGYEYLGNNQPLIITPLTEKCYLTMTQALAIGLGGNPFGPAGTGKTETIKALGNALGKMVIVFNCDESNSLENIQRVLIGIIGSRSWGCFDEFNRLSLKELSSISQTIFQIQNFLRHSEENKEGKLNIHNIQIKAFQDSGIFITMNPMSKNYRGRNKLPENLKVLFRPLAMSKPNSNFICRIMFICTGFTSAFADEYSNILVKLFKISSNVIQGDKIYDWGLRTLKSCIFLSGDLMLKSGLQNSTQQLIYLIQSIEVNVVAKLQRSDRQIFKKLLRQSPIYQNHNKIQNNALSEVENFEKELGKYIQEYGQKVLRTQLKNIQRMKKILEQKMGFALIGKSQSGKTYMLNTLQAFLNKGGAKIEIWRISPKAGDKGDIFGKYTNNGFDFIEGVFVQYLRKAIERLQTGFCDRAWIIFEGDIDPLWVENLNSVLDDNKLFTMATSERILIPSEINIIFEAQTLEFASMATISRIGILLNQLKQEENEALQLSNENSLENKKKQKEAGLAGNKIKIIITKTEKQYLEQNDIVFFCNKKSSSGDLIKFLESNEMPGRSFLHITIHDLDYIECDEYGTRSLEQLIIQLVDNGQYYFNAIVKQVRGLKMTLIIQNSKKLSKINQQILNRSTIIQSIEGQNNIEKEENNVNKDNIFQLYLSSQEKHIIEELEKKGYIQNINFNFQQAINTYQCNFKKLDKYSQEYISQSEQIRTRIQKLICFLSQKKSYCGILMASQGSFRNVSVCMASQYCKYEIARFSSSQAFIKELFEISEQLLQNKKVCVFINESQLRDEHLISYIDQLINFKSFKPFQSELQQHFSSTRSDFYKQLQTQYANLKFVLIFNNGHQIGLQQLLNNYSSFARHFIAINDLEIEEGNMLQLIAKIISPKNDVCVNGFTKCVREKGLLSKVHRLFQLLNVIQTKKEVQIQAKSEKYEQGHQRINKAKEDVEFLKEKLQSERETLQNKQTQLNEKIVLVQNRQKMVNVRQAESEKLKEKLQDQQKNIIQKQEKIEAELSEVAPLVEEAKNSITNLQKSNIDELRNYSKPPPVVLDIFTALLKLMDVKEITWVNMKKILGKRSVLQQIVSIDPKKIDMQVIQELELLLKEKQSSFDRTRVQRVSVAAAPISDFIIALVKYVNTALGVKPLQDELDILQQHLKKQKSEIYTLDQNIQQFKMDLIDLENTIHVCKQEIEHLILQIRQKEHIINKAEEIITNLSAEDKRWGKNIQECKQDKQFILENVCIVAFYGLLASQLPPQQANQVFLEILSYFGKIQFNIIDFIFDSREQLDYDQFGVPQSEHFFLNLFIMKHVQVPFIINDTEGKFLSYIERVESSIERLSPSDPKINFKLELAIKVGKPVYFIMDNEPKNGLILELLSHNIKKINNVNIISYLDKKIEVNDLFRYYAFFTGNIKDDSFLSQIQQFNFTSSIDNLKEDIITIFINHQDESLEKKKTICKQEKILLEKQIIEYEDKMLLQLSKGDGNILEDDELVEMLKNIKSQCGQVETNIKQLNVTLKEIEERRNKNYGLANILSQQFEITNQLFKINQLYRFSFGAMLQLLNISIKKNQQHFDQYNFFQLFQKIFFQFICQGLNDDDKKIWLLHQANIFNLFTENTQILDIKTIFQNKNQQKENNQFLKILFKKSDKDEYTGELSIKNKQLYQYIEQKMPVIYKNIIAIKNKETYQEMYLKSTPLQKYIMIQLYNPNTLLQNINNLLNQQVGQFMQGIEPNLKDLSERQQNCILFFTKDLCEVQQIIDKYMKQKDINLKQIALGNLTPEQLQLQFGEDIQKENTIYVIHNIHIQPELQETILQFANIIKNQTSIILILTSDEYPNYTPVFLSSFTKIYRLQEKSNNGNVTQINKLSIINDLLCLKNQQYPFYFNEKYDFNSFDLQSSLQLQEQCNQRADIKMQFNYIYQIIYESKVSDEKDIQKMKKLSKIVQKEGQLNNVKELSYSMNHLIDKKLSRNFYFKMSSLINNSSQDVFLHIESQNVFLTTLFEAFQNVINNIKLEEFEEKNPIFKYFIKKEIDSIQQIISKIKEYTQQIKNYLNGLMKLFEIVDIDYLLKNQTPESLQNIFTYDTQLLNYIQHIPFLWQTVQENIRAIQNKTNKFDVHGIINYVSFFQIIKLNYGHDLIFKSNIILLSIDSENSDFILQKISTQGFQIDNGRRIIQEELLQKTNQINNINVKISLRDENINNFIQIPLYYTSERENYITSIFFERNDIGEDYTLLNNPCLYIHDTLLFQPSQ